MKPDHTKGPLARLHYHVSRGNAVIEHRILPMYSRAHGKEYLAVYGNEPLGSYRSEALARLALKRRNDNGPT